MSSSEVIARLQQDPDGLDFASLRSEGIARAQELAGNIWTDYNLHDPGVTILEQLCFGLTELAYQANVPVADYLANERGLIDFNQYALYKPQDIFPTRPVTAEDYCKRLLDEVPEIDAVTITTLDAQVSYGACLYQIAIKLLEPLTGPAYSDAQKKHIVQKVQRVFLQNRNLGEDLASVNIEQSEACFLKGVIETTGKRNTAAIYADVFFQVARKISSNIRIERYETLVQQEMDLADIFTGPLTRHGYIYSDELNAHNSTKSLEELNGLVAKIEGVKKVYRLELVDSTGKALDTQAIDQQSFFLKFPEDLEQQQWLKIDFNPGKTTDPAGVVKARGETIEVLMEEARRALQKLEFEYRAFRTNKTNATNFYPLPQGRAHSEIAYYSVQHHFPNVYGINAAGVPHSELAERKIQAQQLKSYLYPCEQLLANMLAHIQNLQQLFSLNEQPNHSYFAQYLDNHHIPNFVELYANDRIDLAAIQAVQAKHDQAWDRKSRALDTLLALYGEEFSQEALLHFNYYHEEQPDYWAIDNKIRYLLHLVEISNSRSGAFNTSEAHWQSSNLSSLHKKINILLGIQQLDSITPLSQCFAANQINLVDDKTMGQRLNAGDSESAAQQPVPKLKTKQQQKLLQWNYTPSKALTLSPAMICEGTSIDAYRLRPQSQGDLVDVYFYSQAQDRWTALKKSMEREQAIAYVHKFKKIITDINAGSEGFYLLEHILLRPRTEANTTDAKDESQTSLSDDFYHCRLSFIFPKWTARFANPAFRQFAEKTIANHLPAHLFPQVYWLSLREMEAFERSYQPWLDALHQYEQQHLAAEVNGTITKTLDRAAQRVRAWLEQHTPSAAYWI
ncbi:hypothetical protein [Cellvibrio sp. OA-2007]|uniref:hypothetical protein n=1 Tax=Cellvibrio sp. OA-2007 TaxID=529823 RepID=UPI000782C6FA|nr:hypothetical protein [Cellvibrio sp. OA-2007]